MTSAENTYPEGFEWDEAKRRTDLAKHGIDFVEALAIFDGVVVDELDPRRDDREERRLALGEVDGRILLVVYTHRNGDRRLISARRANADERRTYYARLPPAGSPDEGPD